jgi:hypothetical protein
MIAEIFSQLIERLLVACDAQLHQNVARAALRKLFSNGARTRTGNHIDPIDFLSSVNCKARMGSSRGSGC